jgi:hypothetical protein
MTMDQYQRVAQCVVDADEELARDLIAAVHALTRGSPDVASEPRRRLWALQAALREALGGHERKGNAPARV